MLSKREPKTNHQAHSMVTLSSPRRLLLRPLFLRRLPLHHLLLRPALLERGHQQLPNDPRFLGRGILDIFCSLPNGTPHYAAVFFPVLDSSMLTNWREVAPEISEEIGAFGCNLNGLASRFTPKPALKFFP